MKKSKIRELLSTIGLAAYVKLIFQPNALKEIGWFNSYNKLSAIDRFGNAIPWCTYPFIAFIENRLKKDFAVFEYGSGNSTLWLANFVNQVTTVEHNKDWFDIVSKNKRANIEIIFKSIENQKSDYINACQNNLYDIILVDGRYRVDCLKVSIHSLTKEGVIVLDNSEREKYKEGFKELESKGFRHIAFWGMSPGVAEWNCTTIFYKDGNCLNI